MIAGNKRPERLLVQLIRREDVLRGQRIVSAVSHDVGAVLPDPHDDARRKRDAAGLLRIERLLELLDRHLESGRALAVVEVLEGLEAALLPLADGVELILSQHIESRACQRQHVE